MVRRFWPAGTWPRKDMAPSILRSPRCWADKLKVWKADPLSIFLPRNASSRSMWGGMMHWTGILRFISILGRITSPPAPKYKSGLEELASCRIIRLRENQLYGKGYGSQKGNQEAEE